MTATYSPVHPHEPAIPPALDADGRCLVCRLIVELDDAERRSQVAQAHAAEWRERKEAVEAELARVRAVAPAGGLTVAERGRLNGTIDGLRAMLRDTEALLAQWQRNAELAIERGNLMAGAVAPAGALDILLAELPVLLRQDAAQRAHWQRVVERMFAGAAAPQKFCVEQHYWRDGNTCPACGRGECLTSQSQRAAAPRDAGPPICTCASRHAWAAIPHEAFCPIAGGGG